MESRPLLLILLVLRVQLKMVHAEGLAEGPPLDSKGREFTFAIPAHSQAPGVIPIIEVTGESYGVTQVSVEQSALRLSYAQNVTYREVASFPLPSEAVAGGAGFFDGAVIVTASQEVSVSCRCQFDTVKGTHLEGFLAIPVDALGKEYYVVTYDTGEPSLELGHLSEFIITATQSNTFVSVELRDAATFGIRSYQAGEIIEFELRRSESAQIQSSSDLTGSKVTASEAVALVAGNDCSDTMLFFRYCSYLVEQLPPVSTWGRSFVLAHTCGNNNAGYIWRILAPFPNTTLTFIDNHVTRVTVYDPIWYDYQLETKKIVMLTADRAVMVVQYIASGKSSASALTLPTEQFTQSAIAATATGSVVGEYTLVYHCAEESSLLLNEKPLRYLKDSERLQEKSRTYCAVTLGNEDQQDVLTVSTVDPGHHLSLQIQYFETDKVVSAFPAGMLLSRQISTDSAGVDVTGHSSPEIMTEVITVPAASLGPHEISTHHHFGPTTAGLVRTTAAADAGSKLSSGLNIVILGVCGALVVVLIPSLVCHVITCTRRKRRRSNVRVQARAVRFSAAPVVPQTPNPSEGTCGGSTAAEVLIYETIGNDNPIEHSYCTSARDDTLKVQGDQIANSNRYSTFSLDGEVQQTYYKAGN